MVRLFESCGDEPSCFRFLFLSPLGRISLISTEGVGTSFIVVVPVHQLRPSALPPPIFIPNPQPQPVPSSPGQEKRPCILLAEDQSINQKLVVRMLQDFADVIPVKDGREAIEQCQKTPSSIDMILMDVRTSDPHTAPMCPHSLSVWCVRL
jgi:hypothetical protein